MPRVPRELIEHELHVDPNAFDVSLPYPVFMSKSSTHRMHDPGSIVPHIRPKVFE
jgi:hypothetical protein